MLSLERKEIGKGFHPFLHYENDSKDPALGYVQVGRMNKILKYAPKYLDSFLIRDWLDGYVTNPLKRVKKVKSISEDYLSQNTRQWRLVLQNKFKTIQEFDSQRSTRGTIAKSKAFSMVSKVSFSGETSFLLRYMPGLTNLKSLFLKLDDPEPNTLKGLDLMPKTLSSLKNLGIDLSFGYQSSVLFSDFVENKNILRALTHLALKKTSKTNLGENFETLPILCKHLIDLEVHLSDADENMKVLKSLRDFENLRKIKIISDNLLLFLENFTLPPLTKEVFLKFVNISKNKSELFTQSPEDALAKNPRFINFFEQWSDLQNFTSLKASLSNKNEKSTTLIFTLMNLILQRIPGIVSFDLNLDHENAFYNGGSLYSIDLTNLFETLQKSSNRLQTIRLQLPRPYSLAWPFKQNIIFPELTHLKLSSGSISDLETIQNVFNTLNKPVSQQKNVKIRLKTYITRSNEDLLNLVKVLRKPPRNSQVRFGIQIEALDLDTFDEIFQEFMEEAKITPVIRNVSVKIKILCRDSRFTYEEVETLALDYLKEMFENVDISNNLDEKSESFAESFDGFWGSPEYCAWNDESVDGFLKSPEYNDWNDERVDGFSFTSPKYNDWNDERVDGFSFKSPKWDDAI